MASRLPILFDRFGTPTDAAWGSAAGVVLSELAFGAASTNDRSGTATGLSGSGGFASFAGTKAILAASLVALAGAGTLGAPTGTRDVVAGAQNVAQAQGPFGAPLSSVVSNTSPTFSTSGPGMLLAFVNADGAGGNSCTGVSGAGLTWSKCGGGAPAGDTTSVSEIWWAWAGTALTNVTVTATVASNSNFGLTIVRLTGARLSSPVGQVIGPRTFGSGATSYPLDFTGLTPGSMLFGAAFPESYIGATALGGTTIIDAQNGVALALRSTDPVSGTTGSIGISYATTPGAGSYVGLEILPDALSLSEVASLGSATGTAALAGDDRTGTATALTGTGAYSTGDGAKASSSTAGALSGAGALGLPTSSRAVSGTLASLVGAGTLGNATGNAALSSDDRTGTATGLGGAGALGQPTGTKDTGGPVAGLAGAAALGDGTGTRAASGTAASLVGTGSLGVLAGAKGVGGEASSLVGASAYSSADGFPAGVSESRSGTATSLVGTGALSSLDGARGAQGSGADLSGGGTLGVVPGGKGASPFALEMAGAAALGAAAGTKGGEGSSVLAAAGWLGLAEGVREGSGGAAALAGTGDLGLATGYSIRVIRNGTALALAGTGALGAPTARSERTGWIRVLYGELLVRGLVSSRVSGGTCLPLECFGFRYLDVRGTRRDPAIWVAPAPGTEIRPAVFPYSFQHSGVCPARYGGECLCHPSDGSAGYRSL